VRVYKKLEEIFMRRLACVVGLAGSIVGMLCAISAFVMVGGDTAYSSRHWAGWVAFGAALLTGAAAFLIFARPVAACIAILVLTLIGVLSINLFYINTIYLLAIPFWFVSCILSVSSAGKSHP
jgi:hypothetical protein